MQKKHFLFSLLLALLLSLASVSSFSLLEPPRTAPQPTASAMYRLLGLEQLGLCESAFRDALYGRERLIENGRLPAGGILAIADFSQSSREKRLYVIDLEEKKILYRTYVSHGRNSGADMATRFSNAPASFCSSPGFYRTASAYAGSHGRSMKLTGLEDGINDNAAARGIVLHGAEYAEESFIRTAGRLGRSEGCPAVPSTISAELVDVLSDGNCFFVYTPNDSYRLSSAVLR